MLLLTSLYIIYNYYNSIERKEFYAYHLEIKVHKKKFNKILRILFFHLFKFNGFLIKTISCKLIFIHKQL